MVPNNNSHYMNGGGDAHAEGQRLVHGVPEAAMQYPRQVNNLLSWTKALLKYVFCFMLKSTNTHLNVN